MGSLFKSPKLVTPSTLSGSQQGLLGPLAQYFQGSLGQAPPEVGQIEGILGGGKNPFMSRLAQGIFKDSLLGPAMQTFQRSTLPALEGQFANIGGTLSSRRDRAILDTTSNIYQNAQSGLASILPNILGTQISGLSQAGALRYAPIDQALRFALGPTTQTAQQPGGPGWGLLDNVLGGAATLGTAFAFRPQASQNPWQ